MMKKIYLLLDLMILLLSFKSSIAQLESNQESESNQSAFSNFLSDMKHIHTYSFSPSQHQNWKLLTYSGLMIFFLTGNDSEFHEKYGAGKSKDPTGVPRLLGDVGTFYDKPGTLYFTAGLTGAMYTTGLLFNDYKLKETTNLMVRSLIISGIYTTALKIIIGRARPYVANNSQKFRPFNFSFNADYMSMPSGHTSSIFAMMTVLAKQYDTWYIKIPAYTFAVSVACQRMISRKHWGSDLIIGGLLGYLIGDAVVKRYKANIGGNQFTPLIAHNTVGVAIQF